MYAKYFKHRIIDCDSQGLFKCGVCISAFYERQRALNTNIF